MTQAETVRLQTRFSPVSSTVTADWIGYSFWKYRFFLGLIDGFVQIIENCVRAVLEFFGNCFRLFGHHVGILLHFCETLQDSFKIVPDPFESVQNPFKILRQPFKLPRGCARIFQPIRFWIRLIEIGLSIRSKQSQVISF